MRLTPPSVTVGWITACASGCEGPGRPLPTTGDPAPRPVVYSVRSSPIWIGLESVTRRLLAWRTTMGTLVKGPAVPLNTAGELVGTTRLKFGLVPPGVCSTITTLPKAWNGICALTCVEETKINGIGCPFTVRQLCASAVGRGIW